MDRRSIQPQRNFPIDVDLPISASVSSARCRNWSSACSATAVNARITASDRGICPDPAPTMGVRREQPISTCSRMSFMTCSFSTECLLSRARELLARTKIVVGITYGPSSVPNHVPIQAKLLEPVYRFDVNDDMTDQPICRGARLF